MMKTYLNTLILLMAFAVPVAAQSAAKPNAPRVGEIRQDEKYFRLESGCDNHVIYTTKNAGDWIFLSDREGKNAWMNIDGHNVELTLKKTVLLHRRYEQADATYQYRFQDLTIIVSLLQSHAYVESEPAKIVARRGRSGTTIRAYVGAQCH